MKIFICIVALAAAVMGDASLEKTLRESNDQFTAKMFTEVVKTQPGKSMVMSAFSTLSPLAQLALASVGETHDETLKTIGFPNDNVTKDVFADVNRRLRSVDGIELKLANRIYVKQGSELNEQFAAVSRDIFASDVKNVDFSKNVQTAAEINSWVEENTNNRIKDLVNPDSLTANTAAVLVNAIYFKGKWKHQFNTQYTKEADFHMTKDKTVKVQMMHTSQELKYGESQELDAKLLELPYEGETSSLLVVLPNEIDGINSLIEKLKDPSALNKVIEKMSYFEVDVSLPRFKIETTTNLKDVLTKMGCKRLFTPGDAQLDNLLKGNSDLYISEAIQKAFIEVNEEGAEAAAANVIISIAAAFINNKQQFRADRPFYFELRLNDLTLFTGVFAQPS